MKRVLFVIDTLRMGGAEKSLVSLLKALDPNRIKVDLFVFEQGGVLQSEVPDWVSIIAADTLTSGMTLEIRNYLGKLVKSGHIRAAIVRLYISLKSRILKNNGFSWGIIKRYIPELQESYDIAIGYLEGVPDFFVLDKVKAEKKIGWIHIDYSTRRLSAEEIEYYNRFDELVTISNICRNAFINIIPQVKSKIRVLENIVLIDEVRKKALVEVPDSWDDSDVVQLVSVGRLDYQKGMDIAARAAKVLVDRNVSFCWHVYGKGVMKDEIEQYIKDQGIEDSFILEGIRENPYPYIKKATIIVQPSRFEGKSIVLDEAKILGKAIVVTSYPTVTDQIVDRVTGLITNIDPEAIADGIEILMNNIELRKTLESNAANEQNDSYKVLYAFYKLIEE